MDGSEERVNCGGEWGEDGGEDRRRMKERGGLVEQGRKGGKEEGRGGGREGGREGERERGREVDTHLSGKAMSRDRFPITETRTAMSSAWK